MARRRYKNRQSDFFSLEAYFSDYTDCKLAIQDVDVGEFQSDPVSPDAYFSDHSDCNSAIQDLDMGEFQSDLLSQDPYLTDGHGRIPVRSPQSGSLLD